MMFHCRACNAEFIPLGFKQDGTLEDMCPDCLREVKRSLYDLEDEDLDSVCLSDVVYLRGLSDD